MVLLAKVYQWRGIGSCREGVARQGECDKVIG